MKMCLRLILLIPCLCLFGCLTSQERERVHQSAEAAKTASDKYDPKATSTDDTKLFLTNNAADWAAFDQAVNGVQP